MKRKFIILSLLFICLFSIFTLAGCKNNNDSTLTGTQATFSDFTKINDTTYSIKVPNSTENYNFSNIVSVAKDSKWQLTKSISGTNPIPSKIGTLAIGDNVYYIMVTDNAGNVAMYKLSVRRKPMYTLNFQIEGGNFTPLAIEEDDSVPNELIIPTNENYNNFNIGYHFEGWYNGQTKIIDENGLLLNPIKMQSNLILTAKFEKNIEMSNFEFTSTPNSCEITGVVNNQITNITVPDYVTSISYGAFRHCQSLQEITIPFVGNNTESTVGYQKVFGYIFGYYTVTPYTDPDSIISGTICQYTWKNPYYPSEFTSYYYYIPQTLRKITLTNTTIVPEGAFRNCRMLDDIILPTNITKIEQEAFKGTRYYTHSDGVVYVQDYLIDARELEADTYTIKEGTKHIAEYAFSNCRELYHIIMPNSVTHIGEYAFNWCDDLVSIKLSNNLRTIDNEAFYYCTALEEIIIPRCVEVINGTIFTNIENLVTKVYCEIEERPEKWSTTWNCFQEVSWGYNN